MEFEMLQFRRDSSWGHRFRDVIVCVALPACVSGEGCWTGSFTPAHCCNEIFGQRGNPYCWDSEEFTFDTCCAGELYRAQTCAEFVTNFQFASLQYRSANSLEACAASMEAYPSRCNSVNISMSSCPACASISEHLVTYIRCVRQEQEEPGFGKQISLSGAIIVSESRDFAMGSPVFVAGEHHPTVLRPRGTHEFSYVAPAFDAYVGDELIHAGRWMPHETHLLTELLRRGDVVVDAGANIGGFTLPMSRAVGPTGQVHAFEPFRLIYQLLTANCALNGLQSCYTYHKGLGSEATRKTLRMPGFNGVGNPSKMFVADEVASEMHIHYDTREEVVEVMKLDDLELPKLNMLKIDVESMEVDLLLGAEQTLRQFRPVIYVEDSEAGDLINMREPTTVMKLLSNRHSYACLNLAQSGLVSMTSLLCVPAERFEEVKAQVFSLSFAF